MAKGIEEENDGPVTTMIDAMDSPEQEKNYYFITDDGTTSKTGKQESTDQYGTKGVSSSNSLQQRGYSQRDSIPVDTLPDLSTLVDESEFKADMKLDDENETPFFSRNSSSVTVREKRKSSLRSSHKSKSDSLSSQRQQIEEMNKIVEELQEERKRLRSELDEVATMHNKQSEKLKQQQPPSEGVTTRSKNSQARTSRRRKLLSSENET